MDDVKFALQKWLRTMSLVYNLTGALPPYIIDDFSQFIATVPEKRRKQFYANLKKRHEFLLPFLLE